MARVVLEHLGKQFGSVAALRHLDLDVAHGEFMALLGPSGCGKTTTLLLLAGIYRPTSGQILFDGVVVNDLPPQDRHVGMVFQSYALYPHMTVFENIAFPLRLLRRPPDEVRRRVGEVAALVQIEGLMDRKPSQLSGGQQQRVALARALVKEPTLLLLDEPLSNLDAKLRVLMRAEIKRLQRQLGITTILVTHDQVEAMTMADRIALLKDGLLQQVGTPDDLYYRPANTFVAGFIGSPPMNFIPARIEMADGRAALVGEGLHLVAPDALVPRLATRRGSEVLVGLRPEDIRLSPVPAEGAAQARILDIEPLGRELVVAVTVGRQMIVALADHGFGGRHDQPVWLTVPTERLYVFDPATDARIA
ncbi:MAG: ABC transporter ATP-binding protein [Armatimonadota bacterium]|nr:ABC transporter ATP-binding protein [Armatimonadota bacterium]